MFNDERRDASGLNKLRTYRTFKSKLEKEPYLDLISNKQHRKTFSRLRCGTHCLRVETGRYTRPKTPFDERICLVCVDFNQPEVETEFHFVMKCALYADLRCALLSECCAILPDFDKQDHHQQFENIMSHQKLCKTASKTLFEMMERRNDFLNNEMVKL